MKINEFGLKGVGEKEAIFLPYNPIANQQLVCCKYNLD